MSNIKALLDKELLTAQELGQLELGNFAQQYKEGKSLVSRAKLTKLRSTILTTTEQQKICKGYKSIQRWIERKLSKAQSKLQLVHLNQNALLSSLRLAAAEEELYSYIAQTPVIMTEQEYDQCLVTSPEKTGKEKSASGTTTLGKNKRALFNGIAILKNTPVSRKHTDERGYYREASPYALASNYGLTGLFPTSQTSTKNRNYLKDLRATILDNYYYLYGYNKQIELVADCYAVAELKVFQIDLTKITKRMDYCADCAARLYAKIRDLYYDDKDLQTEKLSVLQEFFAPLDYQSWSIPNYNLQFAAKLIKDFSTFSAKNRLLDALLCFSLRDEEGARNEE